MDADDPRSGFTAASRETLLLANNLLLATACAMVLLGTLYPLLADALSLGKISVGPPYFGSLFLLLMAPMILLLPFGPLVKWQRDQTSRAFALLAPWLGLAVLLGALAWWQAPQNGWKAGIGVAAAAWVALGTARFVWQRLRGNGRFTAEMLGMIVAHAGIAVFTAGALLVEALNVQREVALASIWWSVATKCASRAWTIAKAQFHRRPRSPAGVPRRPRTALLHRRSASTPAAAK